MVTKIELTQEGADKLHKELRNLIDIERPRVIEQLTAARAQGDLSENADYDAARNSQAEIEARIKEIENILASAKIINNSSKNEKVVSLGSTVEIKDLSDNTVATYKIVGTVEANSLKQWISNVSPLGHALIGKRVGDECVVRVAQEYKVLILKIENK